MILAWPAAAHLDSYSDALRRGWSPDTTRPDAAPEELARIAADPALFIDQQVDPDAKGPPVVLKDGTVVPRIPGYRRWMWDGEFCGSIGFRWVPGTTALPPHCLGHIGYSVVPWKRRLGYATAGLRMLLDDIRTQIAFVDLCTSVDNTTSQHVIEANGGALVERFRKSGHHGGGEGYRYRIHLDGMTDDTRRPHAG